MLTNLFALLSDVVHVSPDDQSELGNQECLPEPQSFVMQVVASARHLSHHGSCQDVSVIKCRYGQFKRAATHQTVFEDTPVGRVRRSKRRCMKLLKFA